jgi:taurine dioxygenase
MIEIDYAEFKQEPDLIDFLMDHGLIVVRDVDLDMESFKDIIPRLGKPLTTNKHVLDDDRVVQELSENGLFGNSEVEWHNDWSYGRGNYYGTMLYNVEGGDLAETWFSDMTQTPKALSYMYNNKVGEYYPPQNLHDACFTEKQLRVLEKQKVTRPCVFDHPLSGNEVLYVSPGTQQNPEVDTMPAKLWANIPMNHYAHKWKPGDLLIWDNVRMMHKRFAFQGHRMLWRTQFWIGD